MKCFDPLIKIRTDEAGGTDQTNGTRSTPATPSRFFDFANDLKHLF